MLAKDPIHRKAERVLAGIVVLFLGLIKGRRLPQTKAILKWTNNRRSAAKRASDCFHPDHRGA
jgi:hypothetical protein